MLHAALWAGLVVGLSIDARAQAFSSAGEVFGGYSYLRAGNTVGAYSVGGWEGSLTGNFNRFLGLEADISDHYNSPPNFASHSNGLSFLFGPHVAFRAIPHVTPFVHVLAGATRGKISTPGGIVCPAFCVVGQPCPPCPPVGTAQTETAFTAAVGGGLDVKATQLVWIRVIQADYLRPYFSHDSQNNLRLSFGVVFRFGR